MSKQSAPPHQLAEAAAAAADFGAAAGAVDAAAASALGVNRTDLRMIGLLHQRGPLTAGQLSTASGLSPAATSTAIQRLVTSGSITRTVDSADRRRATIAVTAEAADRFEEIYGPVGAAGMAQLAEYDAPQLALVADFLRRGERLQLNQAERIRRLK